MMRGHDDHQIGEMFDGPEPGRVTGDALPAAVAECCPAALHPADLIGEQTDALIAAFVATYRPGWMLQAQMLKDLNRLLVASFLDGLKRHGLKCCTLHAGCNCLPGPLNLEVKGPRDE
jgi:hypothetical protein